MKKKETIPGFICILALALIGAMTLPALQAQAAAGTTAPKQLRELSTDRPDLTESPQSVDAGHLQMETDVLFYGYDRHNTDLLNTKVTSWGYGITNFKLGLRHNLDFQVVIEPHVSVKEENLDTGETISDEGFGDITLRAKYNLWGNDGGDTALALLPFLILPTNSLDSGSDKVQGGLILPYGTNLGEGVGLGAQAGVAFVENGDPSGSDYDASFMFTAVLGFDLTEKLGLYLESSNEINSDGGSDNWAATIDGGFTYGVNENLQLDCGTNVGLTRAAEDLQVFAGFSWRH